MSGYGFGVNKGKINCSKCKTKNIPLVVNQSSQCGGDYIFIYEAYTKCHNCGNEEKYYYYDMYDNEPIYYDITNAEEEEIEKLLNEKK